jgi:hypothetical protein
MKLISSSKMNSVLLIMAFLAFIDASGQNCFPTMIVNSSMGTTTTVVYDAQNNMTSVTLKTRQGEDSYSVSMEKTPAGTRKIFTLNKTDSSASPFTLAKAILNYDKNNRPVLFEGTTGSIQSTEKFVYNATGQLAQIDQETSFKDPSGKVSTDKGQVVYVYPNAASKNPSEIKTYGTINDKPGLGLIEHDVLTYDNNKAMSDEFPFSSGPFRTYAANNILTASITYVTANTNVKQSYVYTFNSDGYPISKTYTFSGDSTTDTYEYVCK